MKPTNSLLPRVRASLRSQSSQLGLEPLEQRLALTTLPPGFTETLVTTASDLSSPTAMTFSPTGELWVLEQAGDVEFIRADGSKQTAIDLNVDSQGERGLLGIAFDPSYDGAGANPDYVYLYYTSPRTSSSDPANNQVVRFHVDGAGTSNPTLTSPQMIREFPPEDEDNNPATNGDTNHNGGAIHFGPDGKLYVAIGDHNYDPPGSQQDTHVSQRIDTPFGKLLRLNSDGTNPTDNPFYDGESDNWQGAIWALGLRNPYTFAVSMDGRVFINDVGEGSWEEVNAGEPGANFGWAGSNSPVWEGFENDGTPPPWANYHDPIMAYNHSDDAPTPAGVDITGGAFYPANSQFGADFAGKYFFADAGANFIRYFDPQDPGTLTVPDTSSAFASNMSSFGPVDMKVDSAGNLYYLARGGEVYRISYTGSYGPSQVVGRQLFYNNSKFDGNGAVATAADDAAIATDKAPYQLGDGLAQAQSVSSYSQGINGVIVDISGNHGPLDVDDFTFRIGNSNSPDFWTAAPAPAAIVVRDGAGQGGSDRVMITWDSGVISNTWLQVTVEGNDSAGGFNENTGLGTSDVFYFGSRVGDTFLNVPPAVFSTSVSDELAVRGNAAINQPVTNIYDFDRNGIVSLSDQLISRNNPGLLLRINLQGPPAAGQPMALTGDDPQLDAVAAAIAGFSNKSSDDPQAAPPAVASLSADTATARAILELAPILDAGAELSLQTSAAGEPELELEDLLRPLLMGP